MNSRQSFTRRGFLKAAGNGLLASIGLRASGADASQAPKAISLGYLKSRGSRQAGSISAGMTGALLGLDEANVLAGLFGKRFELISEEAESAHETMAMARHLIEDRGVVALIGNIDTQSASDAGTLTEELETPFFNCASPSDILRNKHFHRFSFHTVPSENMYLQVAGDWLLEGNNLTNWFVLNDSSEAGRSAFTATESFLKAGNGRLAGALEVPTGSTGFKSVLETVSEKKPEVLFLCLEGDNLLRFLEQFIKTPLPLKLAGATLDIESWWRAEEVPSTHGVWPTAWHHELYRYSARELNSRFIRQFGKPMETSAWANWAAVKLISEAIIRTGKTDGFSLVDYLEKQKTFDGHKGIALMFDSSNHQLAQPLYLVTPRRPPREKPQDIFEVVEHVEGIKLYTHIDLFDKPGES